MKRGLLDWEEPMGGLLGGYSPSPDVVDRATFLPIGQYEDGSLTLAWPGFLKDAWEGAQRSFLDAAGAPVPDAPLGTRWSGDLDAFNAASLAPIAGVGMRAAGLAGEAAVAKARPARPLYDLMPDTAGQNEFSYRIFRDGRDAGMEARGTINGPEAFIDWIGPKMRNGDDAESILSDLATARGSQDNINSLGVSGLRALREALRRDFPDVKVFSGERISGANPDRWQSVPIAANPSTAALPSLGMSGLDPSTQDILQRYGLLTNDRPQEPPTNTVPPRPSDPFDRYNDPWGEVPEIINNPFGNPPRPDLPRPERPLPFWLWPPTG